MSMLWGLLLAPTLAGLIAFAARPRPIRLAALVLAALAHSGMVAAIWADHPNRPPAILNGWIGLDAPGLLFLTICSGLFLAVAIYAIGYLNREQRSKSHTDYQEGGLYRNEPEAVFVGCLLMFLSAMTLVTLSQHMALLWVAVEATTLVSAPLIYYHRHHRSLEATWKYLLICSVGIALAMLGNFSIAASKPRTGETLMVLSELIRTASAMNPIWVKLSFVFFLVGYGAKMGLAPMHTWLPDAHSEAPSLVSALLSGSLLNCAFLGVIRGHQICQAAGQGDFSRSILIVIGLASILVAAIFILGQTDFKRMLAYSSVEHMGIMALAVGLGTGYAAGLHALSHSLTKGCLFLAAGNLLGVYRTKSVDQVRGAMDRLPLTGLAWLAGFFAITGTPPFGVFLSEFAVARAAVEQGQTLVLVLYLGLLAVIFLGMASIVLPMTGRGLDEESAPLPAPGSETENAPLSWGMTITPLVLLAGALAIGFWLPPQLNDVLREMGALLGGSGKGTG